MLVTKLIDWRLRSELIVTNEIQSDKPTSRICCVISMCLHVARIKYPASNLHIAGKLPNQCLCVLFQWWRVVVDEFVSHICQHMLDIVQNYSTKSIEKSVFDQTTADRNRLINSTASIGWLKPNLLWLYFVFVLRRILWNWPPALQIQLVAATTLCIYFFSFPLLTVLRENYEC